MKCESGCAVVMIEHRRSADMLQRVSFGSLVRISSVALQTDGLKAGGRDRALRIVYQLCCVLTSILTK